MSLSVLCGLILANLYVYSSLDFFAVDITVAVNNYPNIQNTITA